MIWKEIRKTDDLVNDAKSFIIAQMKKQYKYITSESEPIFILNDKVFMRVFTMHGENFNCLGMEYGENPDVLSDDGDLYYIDDFGTPEDLFNAMLEETKR